MASTIILSGLDRVRDIAGRVNQAFQSADTVIIVDPGSTASLAARAGAIVVEAAPGVPSSVAQHIALSIARETSEKIILAQVPSN